MTWLVAPVAAAVLLAGCGGDGGPTAANPSLDTTPPQAPTGLAQATDPHGNPVLRWTPNAEGDLDGYDVYKYSPAPDRDNAYVMVGQVARTAEYRIDGAGTYWYRVRARDTSGNRSAASPSVSVTVTGRTPEPTPGPGDDPDPILP
jgi:hypothetical protein